MTGTVPAVSICIPAYNAARFLPLAIDSALAQELEDFELVVVDNASKDNTREVCEAYTDPRFRYEYEGTPGQAVAWNRCVAAASGKYVILLHADDELEPGFLTRAGSDVFQVYARDEAPAHVLAGLAVH